MELDSSRDENRSIMAGPERAAHAGQGLETVSPASEPTLDSSEHNAVFTSLVTNDKDIVGLVAYSIYKQNKYDWLLAFSRMRGRMPNESEAQSYLLGESTARRLATYRHLAEATLAGRGLEVRGAASRAPSGAAALLSSSRPETEVRSGGFQPSRPLLVGIIVAILIALVSIWLIHTGAAAPGKF